MSDENTFQPFPKMARLSRECVITEKIDGTNAQVFIWDETHSVDGVASVGYPPNGIPWLFKQSRPTGEVYVAAGSRNKWLTTEKNGDNYGFARWVADNAAELVKFGHGRHFGEWWGAGIQRRYGLAEKRFSLFNVERWRASHGDEYGPGVCKMICSEDGVEGSTEGPGCCHVVPVIYRGIFDSRTIDLVTEQLRVNGSVAAPGFMDSEGIVIWHAAARVMFKKTIKDDAQPKSVSQLTSPARLGIVE